MNSLLSEPGPRVVDARVRLPWDFRPHRERNKPEHLITRYDQILGVQSTRSKTLDDLIEEMDTAGVSAAVVHAEYEHGDWADELNEAVAKLLEEHRERFIGFGTVSLAPLIPRRAIAQSRRAAELGLVGINIQPAFFDLAINDRRLYPLFAAAEETGLVVAIHTGINYSSHSLMKFEHPLLLDEVACDFPELRIVACHGGWPWIAEMVAVARRHPNVYVEFGGLAPKYVGLPGTGWEMMFRSMKSILADQTLFATDWPVFEMSRALKEWAEIGLGEEALRKLLSSNVEKLLGARAGAAV